MAAFEDTHGWDHVDEQISSTKVEYRSNCSLCVSKRWVKLIQLAPVPVIQKAVEEYNKDNYTFLESFDNIIQRISDTQT